jgi:glycosyltransferase involved in cell wall biosynthesis
MHSRQKGESVKTQACIYPTGKKIAVVIDAFTRGGAQRNLEMIIPVWIKFGYQVTLVLIQDSQDELNTAKLSNLGLNIERIQATSFFDFNGIRRFLKVIGRFRNEVVISNLYWSQIWSALSKLRFPHIQLFWVEHNTYLKRTKVQWAVFLGCTKLVNQIFGVSVEVMKFLQEKGIKHVSVVCNAVAPRNLMENDRTNTRIILFVGRLNEQKNPMLALQVFFDLLTSVNRPQEYKFRVLGSGPLKDEMESFVLEKRIEDKVEFLGFLEPDEVALEMNSASVLLMTSSQEGSPLVRLEALERGMCIVTTKTSGLLGLLVDDSTGERTAPGIFIGGSVQELTQHLKHSLEGSFWTPDSINARKSLVTSLSPEAVAMSYLKYVSTNP